MAAFSLSHGVKPERAAMLRAKTVITLTTNH